MNSGGRRFARRNSIVVVIALAALVFVGVQAVLAAEPMDSVTLPPYRVDLVSYTLDTDTSTWIYAITATIDKVAGVGGLSHVTYGVDMACYSTAEPPVEVQIASLDGTDIAACHDGTYNCQVGDYYIEIGDDPTTGVSGIKWEAQDDDALSGGSTEVTHLFAMQLNGEPQRVGETVVAIKAGRASLMGEITGPICSPSAVKLTSVEATSGFGLSPFLSVALTVGGAALGLVVSLSRKRRLTD